MEVLIATFILAVGLVAIMALFPIGAVNMARAINQDRSATHGVNSDAMFRYYWKQAWNNPNGGTVWGTATDAYANSQEPVFQFLQTHPIWGTIPAASSQPSFPVLVNPVGYLTKTGGDQTSIAYGSVGAPILAVRTTLRRCVNYPAASQNPVMIPGYSTGPFDPNWPNLPQPYPSIINSVVRVTTLQDDMSFAKPNDGSTAAVNGEPAVRRADRPRRAVQRGLADPAAAERRAGRGERHRPRLRRPVADRHAVVRDGLPGRHPAAGQGDCGEHRQPGAGFAARHVGGVLDARPRPDQSDVEDVFQPRLLPHRRDQQRQSEPELSLDIKTPIKTSSSYADPQGNYTGLIVVFDNLVEVFDRGTVSATGVTGP